MIRKTLTSIAFLLLALATGVVIPNLWFHDAKGISKKNISCAKEASSILIFDHSIDQTFIMNLVVTRKVEEEIYVKAYTFFGIKYASAKVICKPKEGEPRPSASLKWHIWKWISSN